MARADEGGKLPDTAGEPVGVEEGDFGVGLTEGFDDGVCGSSVS